MNEDKVKEILKKGKDGVKVTNNGIANFIQYPISNDELAKEIHDLYTKPDKSRSHGGGGVSMSGVGGENPDLTPFPNVSPKPDDTCPDCNGEGRTELLGRCWTCEGTGKVEPRPDECSLCGGSGEVLSEKVRQMGYTLTEGESLDEKLIPCPLCKPDDKVRKKINEFVWEYGKCCWKNCEDGGEQPDSFSVVTEILSLIQLIISLTQQNVAKEIIVWGLEVCPHWSGKETREVGVMKRDCSLCWRELKSYYLGKKGEENG